MSASDLASLTAVKAWVGVQGTGTDVMLEQLITAASRFIYSSTGRGAILPATYTEYLDGKGYPQNRLFPTRYPVISVSSLTVFGTSIPAAGPSTATSGQPSGYLLRPWDGLPPGQMQPVDVFGYSLGPGRQNIVLTYVAGYQVSAEPWAVPSTPYQVTPLQQFGPWASDQGVVYAATGVALTKVASSPAVGQYSVDTSGNYTFAAADVASNVLISYGFIPADLNQVCIEIVAERYNYRSRIGQVSKSLGGQETVTYSQKDLSAAQASMLQPFRRVTPAW
jgi:hypothetical protein